MNGPRATGAPPANSTPLSPGYAALLRAEAARLGLDAATAETLLGDLVAEAPSTLRWGAHTLRLGERTLIMGVINVTDDSLSGDGLGRDLDAVLARAEMLVAAGADLLDVGGESTRPGAPPTPPDDELARVAPAIALLARHLAVPLSVDTRRAAVAEAALAAGAGAINDVSGLTHDPQLATVAARSGAALILGHWRPGQRWPVGGEGPPAPRVRAEHPPNSGGVARGPGSSGHPPRIGGAGGAVSPPTTSAAAAAIDRVLTDLRASIERALAAGCAPAQLAVDPGLGFGKPPRVSLALLRELPALCALGRPIVVGPSRKGFIGHVLGSDAQFGWEGTAAAVALGLAGGARIVRVHDVARLARVVRMTDAILHHAPDGV